MNRCLAPIGPANENQYPPQCPDEALPNKKCCESHAIRDTPEWLAQRAERIAQKAEAN